MRSLFGNLHTPSSLSPLTGLPPGRPARGSAVFWFLVCVLGGALQAASLAWPWPAWTPPGVVAGAPSGWLQIVSLALLVFALRHAHRNGQGFWRGWVFAWVWLAGSLWWLYVSMHTYGGLASWMAVLAVAALSGAQVSFLRMLGVGLTLAILADATLVRVLLVPAFMHLMGRFNWWAPRSLVWLHQRVGIQEAPHA